MNEFKRGFGFGLWIGFIMAFVVILLFLHSPAQAQQEEAVVEFPDGWENPIEMKMEIYVDPQQKLTPAQQLKIALQENAKLKAQLESWETSYRKEIIKNAVWVGKVDGINKSIDNATKILQEAYNNEGKLDYKKLYDVGFRVVLDSSDTFKRPSKDKKPKK